MEVDYIKQFHQLFSTEVLKKFNLNEKDVENIIDQVKNNEQKAKNSSSVSKKLFDAVTKHDKIKVIESTVPSGILPSDYTALLYDIRIAGYGPDDKIYRQIKWIRENITRGMTFMKVQSKNECQFDLVIYSNKKFLGGVADDDETQPENDDVWQEFCLQTPDNASQVICMTKVNGEAGHFAGRFIEGQFYLIIGSKNVHMLIKNEEDIDKYTDSRYGIAKIVAAAVMTYLKKMSEEKKIFLQNFLAYTKITVVCELTQPTYQHIVNLSYLKEPIINLLMFTSIAEENLSDSFTAITPHYGLEIGKVLGLNTADYEIIDKEDVSSKIQEIRSQKGKEGCVLYFVTTNGKTIGLSKVKCAWYIMLRALREKTSWSFCPKNQKVLSITEKIQSVKKRFNQIQSWLKFDEEYLLSWVLLGEAFIGWITKKVDERKIETRSIRPEFPIIWSNFLIETNSIDDMIFK